jgi:hypothetical protein
VRIKQPEAAICSSDTRRHEQHIHAHTPCFDISPLQGPPSPATQLRPSCNIQGVVPMLGPHGTPTCKAYTVAAAHHMPHTMSPFTHTHIPTCTPASLGSRTANVHLPCRFVVQQHTALSCFVSLPGMPGRHVSSNYGSSSCQDAYTLHASPRHPQTHASCSTADQRGGCTGCVSNSCRPPHPLQ